MELEELRDVMCDMARHMLNAGCQVLPTLAMGVERDDEDGRPMVLIGPIEGNTKDEWAEIARTAVKNSGAFIAGFASESWMANCKEGEDKGLLEEKIRVSEHPDRKCCIIISIETPDEYAMWAYEVSEEEPAVGRTMNREPMLDSKGDKGSETVHNRFTLFESNKPKLN